MNYKYACSDCGAAFEVEATALEIADGFKACCPLCRNQEVIRVFSGEAGTKTGTYVRSNEMNRLVKISDRARPRKGGCGPGAGSGCCG